MKSEPYLWRNVEIVGGGFVTGIVYHPKQRDLLYARTDIGGAYRWDEKSKRWTPLMDSLPKADWNLYGVESLGIDPEDPKRLWAAVGTYTNDWAGKGALLRSADQGRSWQRTDLPFKLGGNEDGRSIGERLAASGKTVWMGTRHEGLWRSEDYGATWRRVESFPIKSRTDGLGVGIVLLHKTGIYACAAQGQGKTIWRSQDDGKSWKLLAGQPTGFLPHHGAFDNEGTLYLTYSNGPGPNGVTDGAVWKWNSKTGVWTEITPEKNGGFGYAGLAVAPKRHGKNGVRILFVASLDRWAKGDTIWRSTDEGKSWVSLKETSVRNSAGAPYLNWGRKEADLGHWIGALALDPFFPWRVLYGTGATIWGSNDADANGMTHWEVRAQGLEETAIQDLISPPAGAPLISAMGDIGGFRHDDLSTVPALGKSISPMFNTANSLDYAELAPNIMVVSGNGKKHAALSTDGGLTWSLLPTEPVGTRGAGKIAVSTNGKTILWAPQGAPLSRTMDGGATWAACEGVPGGIAVVSDGYDSKRFYAFDGKTGVAYQSTNDGVSFTAFEGKLPAGSDSGLKSVFHAPGNFWIAAGGKGLWQRTANEQPTRVKSVSSAISVGFGAPPPGARYPTVYLNGTVAGVAGIFRSTDVGTTWVRINDDLHHFATSNVITGDPRVFGRVYLGTNGRGILVADPKK